MSIWYEPKRDDLELDGDEVNILFKTDYNGNCYVAVKVKDLQDVLNEPKSKP